jgi:hypothetical protein
MRPGNGVDDVKRDINGFAELYSKGCQEDRYGHG